MIKAEFNDSINDLITENLYQWDTYQTLSITGINFGSVAPRVHFANKKSKEALVVNGALQSDGSVEVSIPNSLLTEKYDILAYIYTNTGLTSKTIKSITIPIIARLKPSEYFQPTDEDIAQIEAIELEAKAIIDGLTASEYDSTETYKRPNIVYYQGSAYMCNSSTEITGVLPTDTSKWQLMCKGSHVVNMSKDDNGNLVFTYNDGNTYTIELSVVNANTEDSNNIPSLLLTSDDVDKVKSIKFLAKKYSYTMEQNYGYLVLIPESNIANAKVKVYASTSNIGEQNVLKKEVVLTPFVHLIKYTYVDNTISINVDGEITDVILSSEYISASVVLHRQNDISLQYDNFIVVGA